MRKPQKLELGDTIGIVAPASSFDVDKFKSGVELLKELGYKVKYERVIFDPKWSKPDHDRQRAMQINRMFADKEVRAIFCAEAGYGSAEIIPYLDEKTIRKNPKIFLGYSDITIILLYLQKLAKMVVFHGPIVSGEIYQGMHQLTLEYLQRLFSETKPLGELKFPQLIAFKLGVATGKLVGGNMSLIIDSIGKSYRIRTAGSILFLEDVNEDFNTIRNYFFRLKRSGKFKNIKGLLLGRMLDSSGKDHDLRKLIEKLFKGQDIPVLYGFPSGHLRLRGGLHVTLPLGLPVTIDADRLSLTVAESAVV
ncbi:MAG: LD-carboxypeptidase [Candidatus Omnitrophica bacterium]|nr:LD-carboxypeptidase [Candidatus Omnitrophota bacterium]